MNRNTLEFLFPANELLAASEAKHAHHSGRLKWWQDQKQVVIDKIKAEGLEIDDSLAAGLFAGTANNNVNATHYRQPSVQIRDDLLRDLQEVLGKITEHQGQVRGYETWRQLLATQGTNQLPLHQDDWWYFFGK